jgi:hypothetical protein
MSRSPSLSAQPSTTNMSADSDEKATAVGIADPVMSTSSGSQTQAGGTWFSGAIEELKFLLTTREGLIGDYE